MRLWGPAATWEIDLLRISVTKSKIIIEQIVIKTDWVGGALRGLLRASIPPRGRVTTGEMAAAARMNATESFI